MIRIARKRENRKPRQDRRSFQGGGIIAKLSGSSRLFPQRTNYFFAAEYRRPISSQLSVFHQAVM